MLLLLRKHFHVLFCLYVHPHFTSFVIKCEVVVKSCQNSEKLGHQNHLHLPIMCWTPQEQTGTLLILS